MLHRGSAVPTESVKLPNEIILNITKYIPINSLRLFCKVINLEDSENIIFSTVKWHIQTGLGIPLKTFYDDCLYYICVFFANGFTIDTIEKYSKGKYEKLVYLEILNNNKTILPSSTSTPTIDLQSLVPVDLLYIFFITKLSETWVWNRQIIKKMLYHNIYDNLFLYSTFWMTYISVPISYGYSREQTDESVSIPSSCDLEIYKMILNKYYYINPVIFKALFNNTKFPVEISTHFNFRMNSLLFLSEKFLVEQRVCGNEFQIANYNLIKDCLKVYHKKMYLNLLREERSYAKRIVRLSNPYSKGKRVKIDSSTYLHIQERLNREGFKGTIVDLEFEKKLLIDEYQRHFFG